MLSSTVLQLTCALLAAQFGQGLDNGLALTPPMGWLSWERYRCNVDCDNYPDECISENLFRDVADKMVEDGYAEIGYEYVIIDDCWLDHERDKAGNLQPDRKRFPSGIKALAAYIHSKGLKFGIYEDYGNLTCAGYPGILGHLQRDAQTFANWDVDYVKLDGCNSEPRTMDIGYPEFGRCLNSTGRPMVYSCSWPTYQEEKGIQPNFTALVEYCNLWRNYDDIEDSWSSLTRIMDYFVGKQDSVAMFAGPGHWNDPDMLLIGNFGLSYDQCKVQMAVWAILAAPLLMSTNLRAIRPEQKAILQNSDIIAVNQDPLGIQGRMIFKYCQPIFIPHVSLGIVPKKLLPSGNYLCGRDKEHNIEVWTRPITPIFQTYYSYAIALVSRRDDGAPYALNFTLADFGLFSPSGYKLKDLYEEKTREPIVVSTTTRIKTRINPSGCVFYRANVIFQNEIQP